MQISIQKWGNSQGIRIPKSIMESLDLFSNSKLEISTRNNEIVLKKVQPSTRKNIIELFAEYNQEYEPTEIDWGKPVGKEIW